MDNKEISFLNIQSLKYSCENSITLFGYIIIGMGLINMKENLIKLHIYINFSIPPIKVTRSINIMSELQDFKNIYKYNYN